VIEALYALLLGYHTLKVGSSYALEDREAQKARLHDIAEAAVESCRAHPLWFMVGKKKVTWPLAGCVAVSSTMPKWESGLLKEIQSGERLGPAGERGLFQLHRTVTKIPDPRWHITAEEWRAIGGLTPEDTRHQTDLGVRVLGWHVYRCQIAFKGADLMHLARLFAEYHHPSGWPCITYDEKYGSGAVVLPKGSNWVGLLVSRKNQEIAGHGLRLGIDRMSLRRADDCQRIFWNIKGHAEGS